MRRVQLICLLLSLCIGVVAPSQEVRKFTKKQTRWGLSVQPTTGFIPDEATAVRVAEAMLEAVYGPKKLQEERPYSATLDGDAWLVRGSVPHGALGGTAVMRLSKSDGRVLFFINEQ